MSASIDVKQAVQVSANQSAPEDLVIVGYVSGAFGLQGWVKIRPYSTTADALLDAASFWLESAAQAAVVPSLRELKRLSSKVHGEDVVARLDQVPDRTAAEALKGCVVKVSRQAFPALEQDEFYWVDLIGLSVQNLQGENLGVVRAMMDNGAQSILRVAGSDVPEAELMKHERLIPFVDHFIKEVDREAKKIIVDWGIDY
ncbi:ribosome maturation factor RimM [Undibacterium fentianense]|uniref:Ribosome maturation factor RimM n=1 Tax=Undibacterium fentianense TaxID=2828728 RepID=A0A941E3Y6_9BURK|nr:ribosome maturation factor RimM [Undibacterium fentianense]MBR7799288.1 ribosome maturation factor RimM [Undibacterium fentianense]